MARRRHITDEEILQAARQEWLADPRASTARIAERIGLSEAAIFKRFRTKVGLMLKAFGVESGPPWAEIVDRGPDNRPLDEQLMEIGTEIEAFFRMLMPRVTVLKGVGLDPRDLFTGCGEPPPVVGFKALRGWFERAQQAGLVDPRLDAGALAITFIGPFQGQAFWRQMFQDRVAIDHDNFVRHVVATFARGFAPEETTP